MLVYYFVETYLIHVVLYISSPSVSLGFTLLCDVADFMGSLPASTDEVSVCSYGLQRFMFEMISMLKTICYIKSDLYQVVVFYISVAKILLSLISTESCLILMSPNK